jgi:hypothetical protein
MSSAAKAIGAVRSAPNSAKAGFDRGERYVLIQGCQDLRELYDPQH